MYATIEFKGKQYKAEKDALLTVDKIDAQKGDKIEIDSVLLVSDNGKVSVGTPYVSGAKVTIEVGDTVMVVTTHTGFATILDTLR